MTLRKDTRKISGSGLYHLVGRAIPMNKKEAIIKAKEIRAKDYPAVVIKYKNGYLVYARYTYRKR